MAYLNSAAWSSNTGKSIGEVVLTELNPSGSCLSLAVPSHLLVDGRHRRRRNVRSSSSSSASSASTSPPPSTPDAASRPKYACDECDRRYATSSNLSRHKQTHRSVQLVPPQTDLPRHQTCPVTNRPTAVSKVSTPGRAHTAVRSTSTAYLWRSHLCQLKSV